MSNSQRITAKGDNPPGIAHRSTLLYVGVSATKGVLAWFSGTSVLLADTIHASSDVLASILVIGIRLSGKKATTFPWGLYKTENFVALISAGFIIFAGHEILRRTFASQEASVLTHLSISMLSLVGMIRKEHGSGSILMCYLKSGPFKALRGAMTLQREPYEMMFHTIFHPEGMQEVSWINCCLRNVFAAGAP